MAKKAFITMKLLMTNSIQYGSTHNTHIQMACDIGELGLRAIRESFLHEILGYATPTYVWFKQSVKVFSAKFSLPMDLRKFTAVRYTCIMLVLLSNAYA